MESGDENYLELTDYVYSVSGFLKSRRSWLKKYQWDMSFFQTQAANNTLSFTESGLFLTANKVC